MHRVPASEESVATPHGTRTQDRLQVEYSPQLDSVIVLAGHSARNGEDVFAPYGGYVVIDPNTTEAREQVPLNPTLDIEVVHGSVSRSIRFSGWGEFELPPAQGYYACSVSWGAHRNGAPGVREASPLWYVRLYEARTGAPRMARERVVQHTAGEPVVTVPLEPWMRNVQQLLPATGGTSNVVFGTGDNILGQVNINGGLFSAARIPRVASWMTVQAVGLVGTSTVRISDRGWQV